MLTEQEAVAQLNEKIRTKQIKESTMRYVEKLRNLDSTLVSKQNDIETLLSEIKRLEGTLMTLKGSISTLLDLAAEEEGLTK